MTNYELYTQITQFLNQLWVDVDKEQGWREIDLSAAEKLATNAALVAHLKKCIKLWANYSEPRFYEFEPTNENFKYKIRLLVSSGPINIDLFKFGEVSLEPDDLVLLASSAFRLMLDRSKYFKAHQGINADLDVGVLLNNGIVSHTALARRLSFSLNKAEIVSAVEQLTFRNVLRKLSREEFQKIMCDQGLFSSTRAVFYQFMDLNNLKPFLNDVTLKQKLNKMLEVN